MSATSTGDAASGLGTLAAAGAPPRGDLAGFSRYLLNDLASGFLVFLIALPLCLAIAQTSGFPPIAGVITAVTGALVCPWISNSEMTIKGPAAGMIVIVMGCVTAFHGDGMLGGFSAQDLAAYRATLAVGVVAAVLQMVFGVFRAGIVGEFFPLSAVHGMLAGIGLIIIIKQLPAVFGLKIPGDPREVLENLPQHLHEINPAIAVIGLVSLGVMFLWPAITQRMKFLKPLPAQLAVLLLAVPLGMFFDLMHKHSYSLIGHNYEIPAESFLVDIKPEMFGLFRSFTTPDFSALAQPIAWKWVGMFFAIGTLESLLSAKAVDTVDPYKRKTNLDRDLLAIGCANLAASCVGGLPMISEIVRSKANIMNGARTRFANLWHGVFLLGFVSLLPMLLHRIPLAALAAMLVYTGTRLAHPTEFLNVYRVGREQFLIFLVTALGVVGIDLLVGICIGIVFKACIHFINGVPLKSFFKPFLEVEATGENTSTVYARQSAVFSNWIPFRRQLEDLAYVKRQNITLDLSQAMLVDHSVMEKLHELQIDFEAEGLTLEIVGLESLQPYSGHFLAARRSGLARMKRVTVMLPADHESQLETLAAEQGVSDYTATLCRVGYRRDEQDREWVRVELLVAGDQASSFMAKVKEILSHEPNASVYQEVVEVMRRQQPAKSGAGGGGY